MIFVFFIGFYLERVNKFSKKTSFQTLNFFFHKFWEKYEIYNILSKLEKNKKIRPYLDIYYKNKLVHLDI